MEDAQRLVGFHHISLRRATLATHQIDDRLRSIRQAAQIMRLRSFNLDPEVCGFDGVPAIFQGFVVAMVFIRRWQVANLSL